MIEFSLGLKKNGLGRLPSAGPKGWPGKSGPGIESWRAFVLDDIFIDRYNFVQHKIMQAVLDPLGADP
jgi:hypothetical protein